MQQEITLQSEAVLYFVSKRPENENSAEEMLEVIRSEGKHMSYYVLSKRR